MLKSIYFYLEIFICVAQRGQWLHALGLLAACIFMFLLCQMLICTLLAVSKGYLGYHVGFMVIYVFCFVGYVFL